MVIKHPPRTISPFVPLMADATRARGIYSAPDQTQITRTPGPAFQAGSRDAGNRRMFNGTKVMLVLNLFIHPKSDIKADICRIFSCQ